MKNLLYTLFGCILLITIYGCNKTQTDFKKFLGNQEIVYTGAVGAVITQPGDLRIGLKWKSSSDPSIVKYVVYWNNKADSQIVKISTKTDSVRTTITGLKEFVYTFTIYSFDAKGNKSIPFEVNNVKVYGPVYASTLLNRAYNGTRPFKNNADGSVNLIFNSPDTININTVIRYTNTSGETVSMNLSPDSNSITLPHYKQGTKIQYQSSYIPERTAIDTFAVDRFDDFPDITLLYVQCDKKLFNENSLPNDVGTYEGQTSISKLWDGSVGPQSYPNIFHSDGDHPLPHHITFDMGAIYTNLGRIEETGRNQSHNPIDFEVWGIADIKNAATTLKGNDPGWEAEMVSKGWTKLKECVRTDDGQQAMKFDLKSNPPPVRYIRIRILKTASGDPNYSNMSELTFWNIE
ncbi:DUF4998 domain-containing protein [Mucilaginibacter sp. SG564]|uniref:DUF4998 domain-containing protein n=1 Tax=unclassified Mucilaginibacter TaxID=2617802 RepID=UPI001551D47D|nr:DUF4998 domain-containing protein [Mucilaginibacter sp. SG564]NOW93622.1 hypothetical protein [Mucilaginibacter sp. SG564]